MSQTDSIKTKLLKNPVLFICILEIIMLFLPGYKVRDDLEGFSKSKLLLATSFENFGGISIILRIFIVISPAVILLCLALGKLKQKQGMIIRLATVLGAIGTVWHIICLFTIKGEFAAQDITVSVGFALWITLVLYIVQLYFVFIKNKKVKGSE